MSSNENEVEDVEMAVGENASLQIQPSDLLMNFRILHNKMFKHSMAGEFCDVTLEAGKDKAKFPVHRLVMSAASEYFAALFTNEMKEKYATDVLLKDVDGVTLLHLIAFCYTGEIKIIEDNVDGVLEAAHTFRLTPLVQQCSAYYEHNLNSSNCLWIWALAKLYSFSKLVHLASNMASDHFTDVVTGDEFKHMESELLLELLSNDRVNVDSEEDIFNALVVWMEFELTERMPHIQDLMKTVRVTHLSNAFLNGEVLNWFKKLNSLQLYADIYKRNTEDISKRESTVCGQFYAVGGATWDEENDCVSMERYCPRLNIWKQFHNIPGYRDVFGTVYFDDKLVIIGGLNKSEEACAEVICLDMKTLTTSELQPMITARCDFTAAFLDGFIYAIGGWTRGPSSLAERYDVKLDQWTELAPMSTSRMSFATAILSGTIFAIGGSDGTNSLKSTEVYVTAVNKWLAIAPMNEYRSSFQAGVANNTLFVYGGLDGNNSALGSVEKYNADEDKWTLMTFKLQILRFAYGSSIFQDWLFVIGGKRNHGEWLSSFEKVNLINGERLLLSPMNFERAYFSAVGFASN